MQNFFKIMGSTSKVQSTSGHGLDGQNQNVRPVQKMGHHGLQRLIHSRTLTENKTLLAIYDIHRTPKFRQDWTHLSINCKLIKAINMMAKHERQSSQQAFTNLGLLLYIYHINLLLPNGRESIKKSACMPHKQQWLSRIHLFLPLNSVQSLRLFSTLYVSKAHFEQLKLCLCEESISITGQIDCRSARLM